MENTKSETLTFLFSNPLCQIKNSETPIRKNKNIQAGAKSQEGGVKLGFSSLAYQLEIAGAVKIEPMTPAN